MVDFKDIENTNDDYTHDETNVIILKDPSKPFVVVVPSDDGSDFDDVFLIDSKSGDASHKGAINTKSLFIGGKQVIDESGKIDFGVLKDFTVAGDKYINASSLSGNRLKKNSVARSRLEADQFRMMKKTEPLSIGPNASVSVDHSTEITANPFFCSIFHKIVFSQESQFIGNRGLSFEVTYSNVDLPDWSIDEQYVVGNAILYTGLKNYSLAVALFAEYDRANRTFTIATYGSASVPESERTGTVITPIFISEIDMSCSLHIGETSFNSGLQGDSRGNGRNPTQ